MKPAPFAYVAATSVDHAIAILAEANGEGKILAGGQSLMPMINFRMVRPALLVDINAIPDLDQIEDRGARLRIGALVRHCTTATHPLVAEHLPILQEALRHVAHLTVRNRGTFCGSLCHADPAAEMPMMALLLDGEAEIAGPHGRRRIAVRELLAATLTTTLASDEMVVAVEIDKRAPETGWGFAEFARRHGDFALACVAATMLRSGDRAVEVRIAAMGVADTALRLTRLEQLLEGSEFSYEIVEQAVLMVREDVSPPTDLAASADYRRHLVGELARNVLNDAWRRASEGAPL